MLVDDHQSRFHGGHDILAFILIMGWRLLCDDAVSRSTRSCSLLRLIKEFHRMLLFILVFQPLVKLFPVLVYLRFGTGRTRETGSHRFRRCSRMGLERIISRIDTDLRSRCRRNVFRIEHRNFRLILGIKVNGRHIIKHTDALLHGCRENLPDSLLILKLDFSLGRMDVHVDVLRIHLEIEEVRHLLSYRNQAVVSRHHRLVEIRMLHISAVHKEELMHSLLAGSLRFAGKSGNLAHGCLYIDGQEIMIELLAKHIQDTLAQIGSTKIEHFCAIAVQGKRNLRIHQGNALKSGKDVIELGRIRFQEFTAGRNIVEDIAHRKVGAHRTGTRFLTLIPGTRYGYEGTYLVRFLTGLEFHLCHSSNRCQSLSTESHRTEGKEIICLTDLRGGMALKGKTGIRLRHSLAIINDLDVGATRIHHDHLNIPGAGINSILHQLLDDRSWSLYHFSCCYLIGNRIW